MCDYMKFFTTYRTYVNSRLEIKRSTIKLSQNVDKLWLLTPAIYKIFEGPCDHLRCYARFRSLSEDSPRILAVHGAIVFFCPF